jgi:hypothetical protein
MPVLVLICEAATVLFLGMFCVALAYDRTLSPIAEPRLDAASETAWYLAASPSQIDTIEYAYLKGQQAHSPVLSRQEPPHGSWRGQGPGGASRARLGKL